MKATRLKTIALLVLVFGLLGAGLFYWIESRSAEPALDELNAPGYLRARQRQAEQMMGPMGATLLQWQDALAQPGTQAVIIAVVSGLVALGLYRAAAHAPDEERSGHQD